MRKYLLLPVVAALLFACVVPTAPANAAITATTDMVASSGITTQTCDTSWSNCTTRTVPDGGIVASTVYGTPSAFGCKWVDVWVTESTFLGVVAYRYHNLTAWCWAYGVAIYNQTSGAYLSDGDGMHQLTNSSNVTYWYAYSPGYNQSGWYTTWHGQVSNCLWTACGATTYPWVEIRAHGDGTYYRAWGV